MTIVILEILVSIAVIVSFILIVRLAFSGRK